MTEFKQLLTATIGRGMSSMVARRALIKQGQGRRLELFPSNCLWAQPF